MRSTTGRRRSRSPGAGGAPAQLGQSLTLEQVTPLPHQNLAYAAEWKEWGLERSIGRPAANLYVVELDGKRTKVKGALANDEYVQASPGGRYLLYIENGH